MVANMHPPEEKSAKSTSTDSIVNRPANDDITGEKQSKEQQKPVAEAITISTTSEENMAALKNAHLSDAERQLVMLIESSNDGKPATRDTNEQLAIELVESGRIHDVNFCDDTCTTPLQHAAFRGRQRLVRVLLERGADVNDDRQTQGYTALMFGALSGRAGVCQLLLEYGARASYINRVGKTASQLAAFCGQHACAAAINNFVSRDMIEYYTEPHGLETEPLLSPPALVGPLHRLVIQTNLHPVHLLNIMMATRESDEELPILMQPAHSKRAVRVLNSMLEKQIKGTAERSMSINECSALKFHFVASFLDYVRNQHQHQQSEDGGKQKPTATQQIVHLQHHFLKGSPPYGFCSVIDQFVCELLRKFPYATQSPLLLQLVRQITQSLRDGSSGFEDGTSQQQQSTTSIVLVQFLTTINGQRFFADDDDVCAACGSLAPSNRKCSTCKMVAYCNGQCQKLHWFSHKKFCPTLQQARVAAQERARKYEEEKKKADEAAEKEKQKKQQEEDEAKRQALILAVNQQPPEAENEPVVNSTDQQPVEGSQPQADIDAPAHAAEAVDAAAVEAIILDSTDLNGRNMSFDNNDNEQNEEFNTGDDDDKKPLIE